MTKRSTVCRNRVGLAALVAAMIVTCAPGMAAPTLERVIMVSRHGVRAPTRTAEVLASLTKRGWPAWPEGAGQMTTHGTKALGLMADYLRATYAAEGLLPLDACPAPGKVEVWADVLDRRTRLSGDLFAERFAPGCKIASRYAGTALDPIFDASKSDVCPVGIVARGKALLATARQTGGLLRPEDQRALDALQRVLAPDACADGGTGVCIVPDKDASVTQKATALTLGAMVAEAIYLEYVEGRPLREVGWGKVVGARTIEAIMPVHERGIGVLRGTPALAARRGAVMARTILAFLQRKPLPQDAPALSSEAKLVMLAGHDSNLLYLAALMGLDWRLPGQPTMTPPGATLAFEVWHDPETTKRFLKVVVYGQTLAQLREATPLDADHKPDVVTIVPEACGTTAERCDVDVFANAVEKKLVSLCGG